MTATHYKFRPDIELLRGVAVVLVVLFHLKILLFKSGFIGVDIFFVISGFLMAAAFSDPSKNGIIPFYERRARRVLPAALIIFFIFFIASPFFFLPFETKKVTESFLGTIFLIPNVVFWLENSYFDEFTFRPMLHYWSLGVEFQYYLTFPLVCYFFKKKQYLYFALFCVSFLLSLFLTEFSSKTAFFLLPPRFWEFLLGYFAYHLNNRKLVSDFTYGNYISTIALCGLIIASTLKIPQHKFPGLYALPPALFTFLYITFGLKNTDASWFKLLSRPFRYLGEISYSIYLIHFPIIFIFIYSPFSEWKELTILNAFFAAAITLLLSIASHKFLETPFRNRKLIPPKLFMQLTLGFVVLSLSLTLVYSKLDYFSNLYTQEEKMVFYSVDDQGKWRCAYLEKIKAYDHNSCSLSSTGGANKKMLLVGDSHMDAIKHLFPEKAKLMNADVRLMKESCVLGEGKCSSTNLLNEALTFNITDIVLHSHFSEKFNYGELATLIHKSQEKQIRIHFIDPVPIYAKSIPKIVYNTLKNTDDLKKYTFTRDAFLNTKNEQYHAFKKAHQETSFVSFYDPSQYLCATLCEVKNVTEIFYHDSHHLSLSGTKLLAPIVDEIFAPRQTTRTEIPAN